MVVIPHCAGCDLQLVCSLSGHGPNIADATESWGPGGRRHVRASNGLAAGGHSGANIHLLPGTPENAQTWCDSGVTHFFRLHRGPKSTPDLHCFMQRGQAICTKHVHHTSHGTNIKVESACRPGRRPHGGHGPDVGRVCGRLHGEGGGRLCDAPVWHGRERGGRGSRLPDEDAGHAEAVRPVRYCLSCHAVCCQVQSQCCRLSCAGSSQSRRSMQFLCICAGQRWWWAGTTATRASAAGCRASTSTHSRCEVLPSSGLDLRLTFPMPQLLSALQAMWDRL